MSKPNKTVLMRFARGVAAVAVASVAAFAVGPEFLGLVPDQYDVLVVAIGAPTLLALEKLLRDGGAGDEASDHGSPTVAAPTTPVSPDPMEIRPGMSARKLAGIRGTPAATKDGQPKRESW